MPLNLAINASVQNAINIPDANAAEGDILVLFFSDGVNVFNKASVSMGGATGDIVVTAGVKYQVNISPQEAQQLKSGVLIYKLQIAGVVEGVRKMNDINNGSVTVSNLPNNIQLQSLNYNNSNNQNTVAENYIALPNDDTIFVESTDEVVITLPNCAQVVGKRIRVKRLGEGDVVIKDHLAVAVYTINDDHGNIELEATPDSWQAFK